MNQPQKIETVTLQQTTELHELRQMEIQLMREVTTILAQIEQFELQFEEVKRQHKQNIAMAEGTMMNIRRQLQNTQARLMEFQRPPEQTTVPPN